MDEVYDGLKIIEQRTMDLEFQIKNNPFVKKVPTLRTFKIVERNNERLQMRIVTKSRSVPYCDCFYVEEEWNVASLPGGFNSCALKVSYRVIFVQSTIMKSMITGSSASESKTFWTAWDKWMKDKGMEF